MKADMEIQKVVNANGINDADYFKHLMAQASADENFEQEAFIEQLKGEKPYLFNAGVDNQPKRVDSTSNKATLNAADRIKGAKTMAEIYQLQRELT